MEGLITPTQYGVIKNRVIWMRSSHPSRLYMDWWDQQKPEIMDEKLKGISKQKASVIIGECLSNNWPNVMLLVDGALR